MEQDQGGLETDALRWQQQHQQHQQQQEQEQDLSGPLTSATDATLPLAATGTGAPTLSRRRSSAAGSASSVTSPIKAATSIVPTGSGSTGSAPSSPKRCSATSLASAPRVGAPLPPAPKAAAGGGSGSHTSSPRKALSPMSETRKALDANQHWQMSETSSVAMADSFAAAVASGALSPTRTGSFSSAVPSAAADEGAAAWYPSGAASSAAAAAAAADAFAAAAAVAALSPTRAAPGPRTLHQSYSQPTPPVPLSVASSAPSSLTGTPVPRPPAILPAASAGSPDRLSPSSSGPGPGTGLALAAVLSAPSMPNLDRPSYGSAPPAAPAAQQADGVLLGVEALERQQAELEQRRIREAAEAQKAAKAEAERQRVLSQSHHLEQLQQAASVAAAAVSDGGAQRAQAQAAMEPTPFAPHHGRGRSVSLAPPSAAGFPPRSASMPPQVSRVHGVHHLNGVAMVGEGTPQDDDTAPSSTCPPGTGHGSDGTPSHPRRTSSFGRFLKTPLKTLRQGSFNADAAPSGGAYASNQKHASDALVVPPKDVDGILEVEGLWREDEIKPLIYGYLRKLGRNGIWQKRWFETDGMHLTYYKSRKRSKTLASLDLCHVGDIHIDKTDPSGCTFTIQVADRPYFLCAASEPLCKHWVINLNRVKEARCQVGGFKLVEPQFRHGDAQPSDRMRSESDECMAPRVVMVANRSRTRALALSETEDAMKEMLQVQSERDDGHPPSLLPVSVGSGGGTATTVSTSLALRALDEPIAEDSEEFDEATGVFRSDSAEHANSPRLIAQLPPVVLARWQKRRTTLTRLSVRLLRWARSMREQAKCITGTNEVVIGSPVHPPGRPVGDYHGSYRHIYGASTQPGTQDSSESGDPSHQNPGVGASRSFEGGVAHADWIDKEKQKHMQSNRTRHGDSGNDGSDDRGIHTVASGGSANAAQSSIGGDGGYESEDETRELS